MISCNPSKPFSNTSIISSVFVIPLSLKIIPVLINISASCILTPILENSLYTLGFSKTICFFILSTFKSLTLFSIYITSIKCILLLYASLLVWYVPICSNLFLPIFFKINHDPPSNFSWIILKFPFLLIFSFLKFLLG